MTKFHRLEGRFRRCYLAGYTWRKICTLLDITMGTISNWALKLDLPYRNIAQIKSGKPRRELLKKAISNSNKSADM